MTNLLYIGQRSFDGVTATKNLPIKYIVSADYSDLAAASVDNGNYVSLELETRTRKPWSNKTLTELATLDPALLERCDGIIPYAAFGQELKQNSAMINPDLKKILDDKLFMKEIFRKADVPYPKRLANHQEGTPFIWKAQEGSSGDEISRTAINQCATKQYKEEYIDGYPICVNAIINYKSVEIFPPSVQIIGNEFLTSKPFGYCGNDFHHSILRDSRMQQSIRDSSLAISNVLRAMGYVGAVGYDFIWTNEKQIYVLEINPRFQNSSQLLDFSEKSSLYYIRRHLSAFENIEFPTSLLKQKTKWRCNYSQFILHSSRNFTVTNTLSEGVYSLSERRELHLVRKDNLPYLAKSEFCIVGTPLIEGMKVEQGSVLAKIIAPNTVLVDNGYALFSRSRDILSRINEVYFQ